MNFLLYFGRKLGRALLTMFLVLLFVFAILRITGDAAEIMLPDDATEEEIANLREIWGLDKPIHIQFSTYISDVLKGNFGRSFRTREPVIRMVGRALPKTMLLMCVSLVFSFSISIPMGIYAAIKRGSLGDRIVMGAAIFGFSMPDFFFGILLMFFFCMRLGMLPSAGSDTLAHLILPALTVGTNSMGSFARFTRSSMLQTFGSHYVQAAVAKGVPWRRILYRHALPNAAIPIVTILGTKIGGLIAGAVVAETVFAWPGMGRLLVRSVSTRDLPLVQALIIIMAASIIAAHLLVDLLYGLLDPRIRVSKTGKG